MGESEGAKAAAGTEELAIFFDNLHIHPESIALYKDKLAALGLNDVVALRNQASMSFLQEQVGMKPEDVHRVMRKLYQEVDAPYVLNCAPYAAAHQPVPLNASFLCKENVAILREIGHGASGRGEGEKKDGGCCGEGGVNTYSNSTLLPSRLSPPGQSLNPCLCPI